jgi:poly(hydroxyalkanoate) depolymerase family esterase
MRTAERLVRCAVASALCALLSTTAFAGSTLSFTLTAGSHTGSRDRQYKVYLPDGLESAAPMVMALHGCQQTHDDVLRDWGLTRAADRHRFVLVAPFITSFDGLRNPNCWGFWFEHHRHQGRGEAEDLHRIALDVELHFGVDPARRYITGLSSGAAMAIVEAVAYNEYWAAAASASGIPYGEDAAAVSLSGQCPGSATLHPVDRVVADMRAEINDRYPIPLMVLQNSSDCTVIPRAADNVRDAHLKMFGDATHNTPEGARAADRPCAPVHQADFDCRHTFYTIDGTTASRSLVESIRYTGPIATPDKSDTDHGHYWIGGADGRDGRWAVRQGPSYPDIIWDFFSRHRRDGTAPAGQPRITLNGANPMRLEVGQPFVDPGATATDPEDGDLAVTADCSSVDTRRAGEYACIYRATDRDSNSAMATRTVVVGDEAAPRCTRASASPAVHILAGRAVRGGLFNLRALAKDDRTDIGFAWDSWSLVTLYEGQPGRWYARVPAVCSRIVLNPRFITRQVVVGNRSECLPALTVE